MAGRFNSERRRTGLPFPEGAKRQSLRFMICGLVIGELVKCDRNRTAGDKRSDTAAAVLFGKSGANGGVNLSIAPGLGAGGINSELQVDTRG
jgi:hypothetical protein